MGVDFNGNASLGCYLRFLVCIDQKRAMIPLGLGQFARTRVTRAHSLEILNFCFHNLHKILRFGGEI